MRGIIDAMATDLVMNLDAEIQRAQIESIDGVRKAGRALATFSPAMATQAIRRPRERRPPELAR